MYSQSSTGAPSDRDERARQTTAPSGQRPTVQYFTGNGDAREKPFGPHSLQDESGRLRELTFRYQGNMFKLKTNVAESSRQLCLETRGNEIKFLAVAPTHTVTITTLSWKLQKDIFSLYGDGDGGLPLQQDKRLCKSLECLGACFTARLFDERWNDVYVAWPVSGGNLGMGQFIRINVTKHRHGYQRHYSRSFDPFVSGYDRSAGTYGAFRYLREVEVLTAQQLYYTANLCGSEVASVIGEAEYPSVRVYGMFNPTVPTLYGLFLAKFAEFRYHRSLPSISSHDSDSVSYNIDTFSDSVSDPDANPSLEVEDNIALSGTEDEFSAGGLDLEHNSAHVTQPVEQSASQQEMEKSHGSPTDKNGPEQESFPQDVPALDSQESPNHRNSSAEKGLLSRPPPMSQSDGSGDLGVGPPRPHRIHRADLGRHHLRRRHGRFIDHRHLGYMYGATNDHAAHVAKDLLMLLLFAIAIILSILTVVLDPAGEENWFKRIEEGAFTLLTLGIPIVLAMRSRLTDNLNLLMPAVSRPVRSLQDFKNMNKGMDHEIFLKQLAKAILLEEEISDLFSFENACYKQSRSGGPLVIPETAEYSSSFKKVWMFGDELCFNKLTGKAFRYLHEEGMLMIERQPADVDGVIVHIRRRDKEYRIGKDPGI